MYDKFDMGGSGYRGFEFYIGADSVESGTGLACRISLERSLCGKNQNQNCRLPHSISENTNCDDRHRCLTRSGGSLVSAK